MTVQVQELTDRQRQELEELVNLLGSIKGRHTELVTVMIPAGFNLSIITRQLETEKSMAANIKSKQTRTTVLDALERIIRELKNYKHPPKNGLAIFCGNVSEKEGVQDLKIWIYEPARSLNVRLYRCDQIFIIDALKEMLEVSEVYGLLVIDRQEATIGLLEGKQIKVITNLTSGVPGKIKAGGQSAARFSRVTEGLAKNFFRRVAEEMKKAFFDMPRLKGILIGGPVPTKEDFLEEGELVTKLKEKVIALKDLGYTDEHGLELLVEDSQKDIAEQELIKEKLILEKFFNTLGKHREKATYGFEKVKTALERGAVEILLISKKFPREQVEELEEAAERIGATVVIISTENQDGEQFYNLTKGVGAILRFQIE
ncbi:MAG: peptide chain release factor aRF-1 [Nanoarchaeota archaeon]